MKRVFFLVGFLLASGILLPAQQKKVVLTSAGGPYLPLGPGEISELRAAAPSINLVAPDQSQMLAELADADGIIGNLTPEMLRVAKKLRWVQVTSAGVERYLTPELVNSNITLTNCKIVQGPEIADHAFALLLALTRGMNRAIANRGQEEWNQRAYSPLELNGRTAVVIGVGGIGTQIAVRASAFGMKVIGVDPKDIPFMPFLSRTVPPDRLDTVLPEATSFSCLLRTPRGRKRCWGPSSSG